jgi:hypothetical protein
MEQNFVESDSNDTQEEIMKEEDDVLMLLDNLDEEIADMRCQKQHPV